MSVQRYISSSFWSDDWVDSLSVPEKLIYMYLLTNESTNVAGVYRITIKRIKDDTGIARDEISAALEKFSEAGKSFFFNGYMIIPKWPKHQKWGERGRLKLGAEALLRSLPNEIKEFIRQPGNYEYDLSILDDTPCKGNGEDKEKGDTLSQGEGEKAIGYPQNDEKGDTLSNDLDLDSDLDLDPKKHFPRKSGGGKDPPKTEEPPPLFQAIKNKIAAEGFFLDDKDVDLLISKTDPTWFGENSFVEFIAEVARGKPGYAEKTREGKRGLFRFLLFEAPERIDEFPRWRAEREKKAESEALAKTREEACRKAREPPSACPGCGGVMALWEGKDDLAKCRSCGGWYLFFEESQEWDFQGPDESWEKPGRRAEDIDF